MLNQTQTLSVIGLGKLGSPMLACFAEKGFSVIGMDTSVDSVRKINEGISPVLETGLQDILSKNRARIRATASCEEAVLGSDASFLIVPTPSELDGSFSLKYMLAACESVGHALRKKSSYHLVVITSTVMPGATEGPLRAALETASGKVCGQDFGLCYSPEFIALGSVVRNLLNPDFFLIGECDERSGSMLEQIYRASCENNAPVARMSFVNAELTKISVNTFITTKITYANMLAGICERIPGADVDVVSQALGMDSRIGSKYLRGGAAFGGPCFPRDNVAFSRMADSVGANSDLARTTDRLNRAHPLKLADKMETLLPAGLENPIIAILGLAYKPDTDVVEESEGVALAKLLCERGYSVMVYDPLAIENAKKVLGPQVEYAPSAQAAVSRADLTVICTPWNEFRNLGPELFKNTAHIPVLLDCWRMYGKHAFGKKVRYFAVGRSASQPSVVSAQGRRETARSSLSLDTAPTLS